jgi:hypothetical protein
MAQQTSAEDRNWRQYFSKLKSPSQFSKSQLIIFVLAFALIGYLLFRTFAAAPVVATIEGEQMSAQLASAAGANSTVSESGSAQVVLAASTSFSNITLPALSGSASVGNTLTVTNGIWNPTPRNYKYAWWRCDSSGNNCIHSPTTASKNTYAIQAGDAGYTIRAQVAPNGSWTYSKSSAPSAVVTVPVASGGSFTNLTKPALSGSTSVGSTLTASNGSWNPTPSSYRYAWWRCDSSGNNCIHSPTATDSTLNTYTIQAGDISYTILAQVAPNGQWSDSASSPPSAVITSPLNYSIVSDSSASGGKAAKFGGGVQISGPVSLSAVGNTVTVAARADSCGTSWPLLAVAVDGASYINSTVSSTTWSSYSASVNLAAGSHQLSITNKGSSGCNLYVDVTRFYGAAPVTTPPTVALSASPTSVTSGQSSTLTWTSTNATSCSASGAWSGSEPTSGSTSTGALNQSSTYTLTCTGAGGSATASVTVGVNSGCVGPVNPQTDRLFSCNSTWNTPLPSAAPVHPSSSTMVQGIAAAESPYSPFYMIGTDTRTDYPSLATPNVTVDLDFPSCSAKTFQVPITGKVVPWGTSARESRYVVLTAGGDEWDFWKMTNPSQAPLTGCASNGAWHAEVVAHHPGSNTDPSGGWQGLGFCKGTLAQTGCTDFKASHISAAAGEIRLRDMQIAYTSTSTWDHALAFNLHNNSIPTSNPWGVPFVAPAAASDGKCYTSSHVTMPSNQCLPEGARVQLDPSISCNNWPSLAGAAQWKLVECRTLQKYGAIIVDTGSGVDNDDSKDKFAGLLGFQSSDYLVPFDLVSHLRVIDWTKWTGV